MAEDTERLRGADLIQAIKRAGIRFVVALPDRTTSEHLLKPLLQDPEMRVVQICKEEDEGVSIFGRILQEDGPIFVELNVEPGKPYPEDFRRLYDIEYRERFRRAWPRREAWRARRQIDLTYLNVGQRRVLMKTGPFPDYFWTIYAPDLLRLRSGGGRIILKVGITTICCENRMCRLLALRSITKIPLTPYLEQFAGLAKASKEYQGHGWGVAYCLDGARWAYYKKITPIWEDDLQQFPASEMALVHVRSAFHDEGIIVENNMPFYDEHTIFAFNGELQGVRLKEEGRIGAEKIFNFIKRFHHGDLGAALQKGTDLIKKRTRYVRAMNIIMTDKQRFYVSSSYAETPEYFQMAVKQSELLIICSEPLPQETNWQVIPNNSFQVF